MKTITVRADDKLVERLNHFREIDPEGSKSQSDFILKAIEEKIERVKLFRSGGLELKIPNPQMYNATDEQKINQVLNLSKCSNAMAEVCVSLDPGIDHIKAFYKDRLILNTKDIKENFKENFSDDLEYESKIRKEVR
ncbi:MAG: hypothetical protein RSD36_15985 [Terrisporobacter sp.]